MNRGIILNYFINPRTEEFEYSVWFDGAQVHPVTIRQSILVAAGICCAEGTMLEALIDETATEEFFVQPTFLRPLTNADAILNINAGEL